MVGRVIDTQSKLSAFLLCIQRPKGDVDFSSVKAKGRDETFRRPWFHTLSWCGGEAGCSSSGVGPAVESPGILSTLTSDLSHTTPERI